MQLAKLDNGQLIFTYTDSEDRDMINRMIADGFKLYIEQEQPQITLSEFQTQELCYRDEGHQIVGYYEIIENSTEKITAEIDRLKAKLTSTDYQIIKSYEYTLSGEPSPYDIAVLHQERQFIRDRIGRLELICSGAM